MRQILEGPSNPLVFQTYSTPLVRGIFASLYMKMSGAGTLETVRAAFEDYYGEEKFVRWVDGCPDVSAVQHSNLVDIGASAANGFLTVWSTLDNLQKGAAGQAVQNMNIALGLEEKMALESAPAFP